MQKKSRPEAAFELVCYRSARGSSAASGTILGVNVRGAGPSTSRITSPADDLGSQRRCGVVAEGGGHRQIRRRSGRHHDLGGASASCSGTSRHRVAAGHEVRASCTWVAFGRGNGGARGERYAAFNNTSFQSSLDRARFSHNTRNLRLGHIRLVLGNSDSSQDTDDRHNDHQFDERETLLHVACDRTTVHLKKLQVGWFEPGNQARSAVPTAASVPPRFRPLADETGHFVRTQVTSSDTNRL